ncbi:MAG: TraR/DksA C4-type zinc finger protein [Proteobacteria bacterium]|nr:TraR/DksA C4-type zinc finger protein [Pseudomonadota bacterium]
MGDDLNLDHFRTLLEAQRSELSGLIAGARDQGKPVELDQSRVGRLSRMDAMRDQAMAQETERRRQIGLARVATALKRLDEGAYGYCLLCDEEIPIKRLEFDPSVTTCVNCARS